MDKDEIIDASLPHCLNCGRPVEIGQTECECGYELADIECSHCKEMNEYTNNYCTSCGKRLWNSSVTFPNNPPRGCQFDDRLLLDSDFLEKELVRTPHQTDGEVHTEVLRSQYLIHDNIIFEICSRWCIASQSNCISCKSEIGPFENACPKCGIVHYGHHDERVSELKSIRDNYCESERSVHELGKLKWTYKLSGIDADDYFNSLAPMIGESQLKYRQRLFREYGENCFILYLIENEWNIYFEDTCIYCGAKFEKYRLDCPSCGRQKSVPALSVLYNDDHVETESFAGQFDDFSRNVRDICMENGGDASYIDDGIAGCPGCSNYFHYLTSDFMDTQKCPHCGAHFSFTATIFQDEWDFAGIPYDEYMETYYGVKR